MTNEQRRRFLKAVGTVAVIGTVAGCLGGDDDDGSDDTDETSNGMDDDSNDMDDMDDDSEDMDDESVEAGLRVAHLSPDAPNVDVYVGGDMVLDDVPFRAVSEYLALEPDDYEIMITAAGDDETVVFDETVPVGDGDYTAAALGELADQNQPFQVDIFEDDLSDPGDMARIRVVHASPDAPAVDITVEESGDALVEGAEFGDAAPVEVPAGSYTLEVRPATDANDGDVVATFPVDVDAETVYSAFAVGYLDPADAPADEAFDLEVVVDHAA